MQEQEVYVCQKDKKFCSNLGFVGTKQILTTVLHTN
jgi:hypothetical protein